MTPAQINALPEHVRRYIHDLQTICDPAGMVRQITQQQDQIRELSASNALLRRQLEAVCGITKELTDNTP